MTSFTTIVLALLLGAAQNNPAKPAPQPDRVSLDGCVAATSNARNVFTLDQDGQTYVLKGLNVRDFVGKHVEVSGSLTKRPRIVGGLYPSPNIAAQAGGIDLTKAAIASQSGPTSQSRQPSVDFTVKTVRVVSESCPEQKP